MYKQLQYDDRLLIQIYLEDPENHSLVSLAKALSKSKSTIYREILTKSEKTRKTQVVIKGRKLPPYICPFLRKWPYVCNNCARANCSREKRIYNAYTAEIRSKSSKSSASSKLRKESLKKIHVVEEKIVPLLRNKLSVEVACNKTHSNISTNSIRYWINTNRLSVKRIDMIRAVKFYNKRVYKVLRTPNTVPARILYERTISKYYDFVKNNKCNIAQLDTVVGKKTDKFSILTIYETKSKFQFGFKIRNTSGALNEKVVWLWNLFDAAGININVLLTDNGLQMQSLPSIEADEFGVVRFRVFYCDPYCSSQKAECERNHGLVRYGLKKGESIDSTTEYEIINIFSKVNSYPRKSLGWKTPFEVFSDKYPNGRKVLESLGFRHLPIEQINFKKKL